MSKYLVLGISVVDALIKFNKIATEKEYIKIRRFRELLKLLKYFVLEISVVDVLIKFNKISTKKEYNRKYI